MCMKNKKLDISYVIGISSSLDCGSIRYSSVSVSRLLFMILMRDERLFPAILMVNRLKDINERSKIFSSNFKG